MFSEALRFEHQYLLYVSLPMELCKSESNKDVEFEFEFEFEIILDGIREGWFCENFYFLDFFALKKRGKAVFCF